MEAKSSSTTRSLVDVLRRSPPTPLHRPSPEARSGVSTASPSTAANAPRAGPANKLAVPASRPDDDDIRKTAGTTRWTLPRADFLDRRLSKLLKLLFHFVLFVSVVVLFLCLTAFLSPRVLTYMKGKVLMCKLFCLQHLQKPLATNLRIYIVFNSPPFLMSVKIAKSLLGAVL